jgi:cytochrome b involved in lipid metabolism
MAKTFSAGDVASHNKPTDLYIIVDEDVYDLTTFQDEHPGPSALPPSPLRHANTNKAERKS